jgi:hypothetical protein
MDPRNKAVLDYLEVERVAPAGTNGLWVVDGYSVSTHPDLCDRVREVNEAAGRPAELRHLYGRPALVAANGVIVAFGTGTYVLCVRVPRARVDPDLLGTIHDDASRLTTLTERGWTLVQPWPVDVPREEGLARVAGLVRRAVERADEQSSS